MPTAHKQLSAAITPDPNSCPFLAGGRHSFAAHIVRWAIFDQPQDTPAGELLVIRQDANVGHRLHIEAHTLELDTLHFEWMNLDPPGQAYLVTVKVSPPSGPDTQHLFEVLDIQRLNPRLRAVV